MPRFRIACNEDGTIQQILRDGQPCEGSVKLEQLYSLATTYFRLSSLNLCLMASCNVGEQRRFYGIQSFLMSLIGLEAFTNTYFHLRAIQSQRDDLLERVNRRHGSLSKRISELIELTFDAPLVDQEALLQRIFELIQLRNEIVHSRWEPASVTWETGATITGLVENYQAAFEDQEFCREAQMWCLLVVARIAQACGHDDVSGFMFHWTGSHGLTLPNILAELRLTEDGLGEDN